MTRIPSAQYSSRVNYSATALALNSGLYRNNQKVTVA